MGRPSREPVPERGPEPEMAPERNDEAAPVIHDEIVVQKPSNREVRCALTKALGHKSNAFIAATWP